MDNFLKFQEFRNDFPFFSYDSYRYFFSGDVLTIRYTFSLSGKYFFQPEIKIPLKKNLSGTTDSLSGQALDCLVFHAGMIELISYWKAACPPGIIIRPFNLSPKQIGFWKNLYFNGLGEFFYMNSIETGEHDFMTITREAKNYCMPFTSDLSGTCLVPIGGGKDSAVTLGILNQNQADWTPLVMNPAETTRSVILAAGRKDNETFDIYRSIDPQLLKLNKQGYLNGHTPFSALLAFYTLLAAYLTGSSDIILSNESSANEATVPGTQINHQYSKSVEFERNFRNYVSEFISPNFNYFSLLRPLSEIQIARLFSKMPQFHPHFRSCNVGSKTGTWCGKCPKCLFTFIILSPFLDPEAMRNIFGSDLLDDPSLEEIYRQLSGKAQIKPFECIGTIDEVNLALDLAVSGYPAGRLPYLLKLHKQQESFAAEPGLPERALQHFDTDHCVPDKYISFIQKLI
jgi:hypothetical protein